jgi:CheY-like chemotaxis protein
MSCIFAYSGEEALDKLCADIEPRLRVILSDIFMDGLELLRQIKTRQHDLP